MGVAGNTCDIGNDQARLWAHVVGREVGVGLLAGMGRESPEVHTEDAMKKGTQSEVSPRVPSGYPVSWSGGVFLIG